MNNYTLKQGRLAEAINDDRIYWVHVPDSPVSNRIYFNKQDNVTTIKCEMFCEDGYETIPVRIIYDDNKLITYASKNILAMSELIKYSNKHPSQISDPIGILIELLAIDIEHSISLLSQVHKSLDELGERILKMTGDKVTQDILEGLHAQEELNSTIRENSIDTHRVISFLQKARVLNPEQMNHAELILHDVESCDTNTSFIFDKVNFLMSNIVSMVSINQSRIIKIFSVVNVALMPPTLVASIYGMNTHTELDLIGQPWAYPYAVVIMLVSAVIPMIFFAKQGWLK